MPQGTKILLIDDDKMLTEMYKERLEMSGYTVEISRDGENGLIKAHQTKPDVILLDLKMPKLNGYEALGSLKSDPQTTDIPVIILSALMRDINKNKAFEAGADEYIIKSEALPTDVIQKIEEVLKKYHREVPQVSVEKKKPVDLVKVSAKEGDPFIQFQPAPANPGPANAKQSKGVSMLKINNPVILFFLFLIIVLIVASDVFFYLQFTTMK